MLRSLAATLALAILWTACRKSPTPSSVDAGAAAPPSAVLANAKRTVEMCGARFDAATGFDPSCSAVTRWQQRTVEPSQDGDLVALLEDADVKMRLLGASALARGAHPYARDPELAARVVAVAEKEPADAAAGAIGYVASQIDLAATGLGDRVLALLGETKPAALRDGVVSYLLDANRASGAAYDATKRLTTDPSPTTRRYALEALSSAYGRRADEVCATWLRAFESDADEVIVGSAAAHLTRAARGHAFTAPGVRVESSGTPDANECGAARGKVLAGIEARAKAGKVERPSFVDALRGVIEDDAAPKEDKAKAIAVARAIVAATQNFAPARVSAMQLLRDKDPDVASFAKKYTSDPDVKNAAKLAVTRAE